MIGVLGGFAAAAQAKSRLLHASQYLLTVGVDLDAMRMFSAVRPYSMVSGAGLRHAYRAAWDVESRSVPGAFVECGVWRGGCAAVMAYVARRAASRRAIWLFDSFEGLPEPTELDGDRAADFASRRASGRLISIDRCVASVAHVQDIFGRLGIEEDRTFIRPGWFQETLAPAVQEIGSIALLRLDGDWYESTKTCLGALYDSVSPGGLIIVDDYGYWEGCRRAVDEFLETHAITARPTSVNGEVYQFQKPLP